MRFALIKAFIVLILQWWDVLIAPYLAWNASKCLCCDEQHVLTQADRFEMEKNATEWEKDKKFHRKAKINFTSEVEEVEK